MSMLKLTMKSAVKEVVGYCFRLLGLVHLLKFRNRNTAVLVVLNYHNFSDYTNYRIRRGSLLSSGHQANFEKQAKWLKKHFKFSNPVDFYEHSTDKGLKVFLTFDDGYKDNVEIALPVLDKHNLSAAFFIVSSLPDTDQWLWHDKIRYLVSTTVLESAKSELALKNLNLGKEPDPLFLKEVKDLESTLPHHRLMMNWDEIQHLKQHGFIIGSHTHTHSPLKFLAPEKRIEEMNLSRQTIASKLNGDISFFAYPNGLYDNDCHSLVKEYGVKYAFTTNPGFNRQHESPLEIKRIGVNASDSIGVILIKLFLNSGK